MSSAVVVSGRSLDELAAIANREHSAVGAALYDALGHAIEAGSAIWAAREQMPDHREWARWRESHLTIKQPMCSVYERIYRYRDALAGADDPPATIEAARKALRGLPAVRAIGGGNRVTEEIRSEIVRLHRRGLTAHEIAQLLGVSWGTVKSATDAGWRRTRNAKARAYSREQIAARRALERERIARSGRTGDLADAYAQIRRALQQLDRASDGAPAGMRRRLSFAVASLHTAEDHVSKAIRLGAGEPA